MMVGQNFSQKAFKDSILSKNGQESQEASSLMARDTLLYTPLLALGLLLAYHQSP